MNLPATTEGVSSRNLNSFLKFAQFPHSENKIVVKVAGHTIKIATVSIDKLNATSFIASNGLEFELSEEEKKPL
ncbi:MAG: hypothetical protein WCO92_01045 [Verrucomicrobiota bacterium]